MADLPDIGADPALVASQSKPLAGSTKGFDPGEGWLPASGSCPVHHSAWIDKVQYRSGDIATAELRASAIDWRHDPWFPMVDIVAYRMEGDCNDR